MQLLKYDYSQSLLNGYTEKMERKTHKRENLIKLGIVCLWCLFFIMLLRRDVFLTTIDSRESTIIEQAESEEYQSVFFKQEKIGYVMHRYEKPADNTIHFMQKAELNLNVAGTVQKIQLNLLAGLTEKNLLQEFSFSFSSPFYTMQATGRANGNTIDYTIDTGTSRISESIELAQPPLLSTIRRPYLLHKDIRTGEKVKIPWFDPFSLTGRESVVEYKGKEAVQIGGRIENLHHFEESFSGARISSWLSDEGRVVKEESPAGFVFIREPKFRALKSGVANKDILTAVAVEVAGPMIIPQGDTMQYRLSFPAEAELDLQGGRQDFTNQILTIHKEKPGPASPGFCNDMQQYTEATAYVQSDFEKIRQLSHKLTVDKPMPMQQVEALAKWVYENIEKRPVLGLPDAVTTLANLKGDCNEHAALFAALARAASLPTRIVAGVTAHNNGFYYHAWNEVCVEDQWFSVDTTTNQIPADLTHIRLVSGEMQEQVRIGALLGKLKIEPIAENQSP